MVVFDVTREDTFINITKWLRNVKDVSYSSLSLSLLAKLQHGVDGVKVVLIGNKVDLQSKRQVSTRRGQMVIAILYCKLTGFISAGKSTQYQIF